MKAAPLALVVLLAAVPACADDKPFHLSVSGGMTISKYRDMTATWTNFEAMKGTSLGVGAAWRIASALEIQPEALYLEKGISLGERQQRDEFGDVVATYEELHVQHYLEIPVLMQWRLPTGERVRPVLEAGPFVAYELGERLKLTGDGNASYAEDLLKNTDYGFVVGAGLQVRAGPAYWLLDGRYDRGLAKLGKFFGSEEDIHSDAFVISTGVRY
jgi:hypothetical protein